MKTSVALVAIGFAFLTIAACTPSSVPPPPTTSQAPMLAPVTVPTKASSALSPEDVAWQQVAEAAKKEGHLIVYSYNLTGDVAISVGQAYRKQTGLPLDIISGPTASMIERIKAERRTGVLTASVLTGVTTLVAIAKQDGLTQKIGGLPELRKEGIAKYDPWVDKDGHILVISELMRTIWINTAVVRPGTEPKSYRDLLNKEWKGKIGIVDPDMSPSANSMFHGLTTRGRLDIAYFKELGKQQMRSYPTVRMQSEALARGEAPIAFSTATSATAPFLREGVPLRAIDMAEGTIVMKAGSGLVLLQGAPQLNAARFFINWFMSQEGQTLFQKSQNTGGFRNDVPNFEPPEAQITPANPIWWTLEDDLEVSRIMTEKVLKKLLAGD